MSSYSPDGFETSPVLSPPQPHEQNVAAPSNWVERFSNRENYSPFTLAVLESCRAFFEQKLSQEHKEFIEQTGTAVLVTGSLLRGNARPGSDIDLMLIIDRSKFPPNITYFGYSQASDLLQTDELKSFVVDNIKVKHPDLYEKLFGVRLAELKHRIEKYQEKKRANPEQYSNDPNHWGNLSEDSQRPYVEGHMMSFYVETGIFDINRTPEELLAELETDDDLIHGFIALLFSTDLQTILGNRETAKDAVLVKLRDLQTENPNQFDELYLKVLQGLQNFLQYRGKNHFYLEDSNKSGQAVTLPSADEILQR